jgi:outer membrane protein OmpA-like peptidoglycan-associated protein
MPKVNGFYRFYLKRRSEAIRLRQIRCWTFDVGRSFFKKPDMHRFIFPGTLLSIICWINLASAVDCQLGANYYQRAKLESDPNMVIEWLHKSAKVCPNFNAWYMLGMVYARQGNAEQAMDAFAQARMEAGSSKSEALALARQADLLENRGQLMRAQHALEMAKRFYPEPTPDWLANSLKKTRLRIYHSTISAAEIAHIFENGTQISSDGRFAVRPAVNLPVHFDFDQATLNSSGKRQVVELGRALTYHTIEAGSFMLVGHTDKRGPAAYNQKLSENRAITVKLELEHRFPSLAGRLTHRGCGETQLLYDGDSEQDHKLNRRVRVTLVPYR